MEINIYSLLGIALIGAAGVAGIVQTIEATVNPIGKIIAGILAIMITLVVFLILLDSWMFQLWGITETLYTFPGTLALIIGGVCGYFMTTSHR
jgi:hypothetical protein